MICFLFRNLKYTAVFTKHTNSCKQLFNSFFIFQWKEYILKWFMDNVITLDTFTSDRAIILYIYYINPDPGVSRASLVSQTDI